MPMDGTENRFCELKRLVALMFELERELKRRFSLTLNEALALCAVLQGAGSAQALTQKTGISQTRMSRVLASLENKKLIVRDLVADDKRCFCFALTKEGLHRVQTLKRASIPAADILSHLAQGLPPESASMDKDKKGNAR